MKTKAKLSNSLRCSKEALEGLLILYLHKYYLILERTLHSHQGFTSSVQLLQQKHSQAMSTYFLLCIAWVMGPILSNLSVAIPVGTSLQTLSLNLHMCLTWVTGEQEQAATRQTWKSTSYLWSKRHPKSTKPGI